MNGSRDKRLATLEQARAEHEQRSRTFCVWRDAPMETAKAAIARHFPKGVPAGARLVVCSWQVGGERHGSE